MQNKYEIIGSFPPNDENAIKKSIVRLNTIYSGSKILNSNDISSEERLVIIIGIYNGFYSCFEIIMQEKKKSHSRVSLEKWRSLFPEEDSDLNNRYRAFRNLMTHQGHYIAGSQVHWEIDHLNDTQHPVSHFPPFVNKKINGEIVKQYTASEWIEECYRAILSSLNKMEEFRKALSQEAEP